MKKIKIVVTLSLLLISACYVHINAQSDSQVRNALPHMVEGWKVTAPQAEYTIAHIELADLKEMGKRKYVVLQCEPDADALQDLSSTPDLLSAYKTGIDSINTNMKAVLAKFWKVCPDSDLLFLTTRQFNAMGDKQNYLLVFCYASCCFSNVSSYHLPLFKTNIRYNVSQMKEYKKDKYDVSNQVFFAIEKPEDNTIVYSRAMPDKFPTKADLAMAVTDVTTKYNVYKTFLPSDIEAMGARQCWLYIAHKDYACNLADKTLLIKRDWIGSKYTENDIKKLYPYPFKLVTSAELDQYVMNQTPGYLFLYVDVSADIENTNGMANALAVVVKKSIVDETDFNTLTSHHVGYTIFNVEITKEDIQKWVDDSHIRVQISADSKKYPDYAGFLIPDKFSPKADAPNNVFCFKNTPLDSCLLIIGNSDNDTKFITKYYNKPSASWDGTVDGRYVRSYYYALMIKGIAGRNTYYNLSSGMQMAK